MVYLITYLVTAALAVLLVGLTAEFNDETVDPVEALMLGMFWPVLVLGGLLIGIALALYNIGKMIGKMFK